jgi:hypothetical protein
VKRKPDPPGKQMPTEKEIEEADKKIREAMGEDPVRFISDEEMTRRIRKALQTLPIDHPMRQKADELEARKENIAAKEEEEKKEKKD